MLGYVISDYTWTGLGLWDVIMPQCRMLFGYLSVISAPFLAHTALVTPAVVSKTLLDPPTTLAAVVGVVTMLVAAVALLRRRPLAAFGILAYLVVLTPESILDPKFMCLQYRAVLAIVPFLMALAAAAEWLLDWSRNIGRLNDAAFALLRCLRSGWLGPALLLSPRPRSSGTRSRSGRTLWEAFRRKTPKTWRSFRKPSA